MLKTILYACALSFITLTASANEDTRDTTNPTEQIVSVENEVSQENTLASDEVAEDKSTLVAALEVEETPVVIVEDKSVEEVLVCEIEEKIQEANPSLLASTEEETQEAKLVSSENEEKANLIADAIEEKIQEANPSLLASTEEEIQEAKLVSSENEEKANLIADASAEQALVVVTEEVVAPEVLACGCKTKGKNEENLSLVCNIEEVSQAIEEQQALLACEKCGRDCNGRHLVLALDDQKEVEASTILVINEEEVKAA